MTNPTLSRVLCSILLTGLVGCATVTKDGHPEVTERVVRSRFEVAPAEGYAFTFAVDESRVEISARTKCDRYKVATVERREEWSRRQDAKGAQLNTWLGISGALLLVTGGIVYVDSDKVYEKDAHAREYNSVGKETARNIGIGTAALGGLLLLPPLVDGIRTSGKEVEVSTLPDQRSVVTPNVPCSGKPVNVLVVAKIGTTTEVLGKTDEAGRLSVDAAEALSLKFVLSGEYLDLQVDNEFVGRVDTTPLVAVHDEKVWKRAREGCAKDECADAASYLITFPNGRHRKEVRALLDESAARSEVKADDATWSKAGATGCKEPTSSTSCGGVEQYLFGRPDGRHASEARDLLRAARPKLAKFEAAEKRAAEAQGRKDEAEARAREAKDRAERLQCRNRHMAQCKREITAAADDFVRRGHDRPDVAVMREARDQCLERACP